MIAGEEASARTLVAFDGLALREGSRVETPWGWLRAATEDEAAVAPANVPPTVVLVIETPDAPWPDQPVDTDAARILPTAAVLALKREDPISLGHVWSTSVPRGTFPASHLLPGTLLTGGFVSYPKGARARRAMFVLEPRQRTGGEPLADHEERELRDWAALVHRHYDPAIEIAVDRTLRALLERDEAQDALIDAVIALENLFGHGGTTEVIFRVTAAAAILLESDPTKRAALRSRLSKVYGVRSKVIHGDVITPSMQLSERKEQAIRSRPRLSTYPLR